MANLYLYNQPIVLICNNDKGITLFVLNYTTILQEVQPLSRSNIT